MEKSRVELYELVWAKPMTHLAKELGLSDVGLRKICVKFGIPLPLRGHWARLQVRDSRVCEMRAVRGGRHLEFRFWEPSTKATRSSALTSLERLFTKYSYGGDSIMLPRHILTIEFDGRYNRSVIQDKVSVKLEQQIDHIVKRVDDKLKKKAPSKWKKSMPSWLTFQVGLPEQPQSLNVSSDKCCLTMYES